MSVARLAAEFSNRFYTTMAWTFFNWFGALASPLNKKKPAEGHAAYRKCPKCGERDFRISDRQRAEPDIYRSRAFRVKWLCLGCGMRETELIEEPAE